MTSRFEPNSILRMRWPLASVAVTATAPLLGCGPGGVEVGFRVTNVAFDGEGTLTLTFSQPVANASAIDPNDFRLSVGRTFSYSAPETGEGQSNSFYNDIDWLNYDYYEPPGRFAFASASAGSAANQLLLEDAEGLIAQACTYVSYYLDYYAQYQPPYVRRDIGIFLHYASGDIPLESESGEALADIGPDWVLTEDLSMVRDTYGFIHLDPQLRIPCP